MSGEGEEFPREIPSLLLQMLENCNGAWVLLVGRGSCSEREFPREIPSLVPWKKETGPMSDSCIEGWILSVDRGSCLEREFPREIPSLRSWKLDGELALLV